MRPLSTLQWRIALSYTALIIISMGAVSLYLVNFVRTTYISNLEEHLEHKARLVGESTSQYFQGRSNPTELKEISQRISRLVNARVTIIALDGAVLAETWEEPASMENHLSRPEIQGAIYSGVGRSTRVSQTLDQELLYTAIPILTDGITSGVARIAVPTYQIRNALNQIIATIVLSAIIVTSLSIGLGYMIAGRTARSVQSMTEAARRLADGDLGQRVESLASDETQELAFAFNRMATYLKNTIDDLSVERNKLSAILDTMADGVVVIFHVFYLRHGEGRIDLMNPAAEELLDISSEEAIGGRFLETIMNRELQQLVSRAFESKEQQHADIETAKPRRSLSVFATPLTREQSNGVLLTLHDLTRIRQADATRRQFVSNVSHELRSPLASVKAMVETLDNGAIEEQQTAMDFIHRIHRDVDRMSTIVEDLLELSRLESGQTNLDLAPTNLNSLIEDVRHEFELKAEAKEITLSVSLPDSPYTVIGERDMLYHVLANLLDNALKFTPARGAATLSATQKRNMVHVSVSDTGIGIAVEHHPHLFERFYRVDSSRQYQGTGLGLAIAKHIVEAHGGEFVVESREGEGSTFSFTIPTLQD